MNCTTNRTITLEFFQTPTLDSQREIEVCPFANNVCKRVSATCNTDVAEAPKEAAEAVDVFAMFVARLAA